MDNNSKQFWTGFAVFIVVFTYASYHLLEAYAFRSEDYANKHPSIEILVSQTINN